MSPIPKEHRELLRPYRMPAEWEVHLATYLVWPHNRDTWPGRLDAIAQAFARMAAAIAASERVRILVRDEDAVKSVRAMVVAQINQPEAAARVDICVLPTDDSWVRDHGPIFVNRIASGDGPAQIALDWGFNSWGEKYGPWDLDDAVPTRLGERYGFKVIEPGIVLEGGSIDVNGAGAVLTTESCLLNPNRNPGLERHEIEDYLRTYLGIEEVFWLGDGIAGDDTDGHVDDIARFVARDTIVTVVEEDPSDVNYKPLRENLKRLQMMRDCNGRPFTIETLPMPQSVKDSDQGRLPASYANFYITNGAILMPTFDCKADETARLKMERLFPGRYVIGIPATDLVLGLGAIHCLTQQHPASPA